MPNLEQVRFVDILPPNLRADETVFAAASALDQELNELTTKIPLVNLMYTIDQQDEAVVDELAWEFHVDFYDQSLQLEKKRALVKNSPLWHRIKGTPAAVEEVVTAAFDDSKVLEWFEYDGTPYRFKVVTKDSMPDGETLETLHRAIHSVKNTRSRLDSIAFERQEKLHLYVGGVISTCKKIQITQTEG